MISKQLEEFLDKYSREKHFPDIRPPPLLVDFYSDCLAEELEYVRQVERISLVLSDVNDLEEKSLEQAEALRKKHLGKKTSKSHHTSFQTFSDCNLKLLSFFGFESASNEQTILGKMIVYTQTKNEVQKAAVIYGHFTQQSEGGAVKYVPTG